MTKIHINTASFSFIGLFNYNPNRIADNNWITNYEPSRFYEENKDYFQQKYYDNWLESIFCDICDDKNQTNHLKLKKANPILNEKQFLKLNNEEPEKAIEFSIRDIDVFLFPDNLGVFLIKIDLPKEHLSWQDIIDFSWEFRKTTINQKYNEIPQSVKLIEENIVNYFHEDSTSWRQYNPNLKTGFYIDIKEQPENKDFNNLIISIGNFVNPYGLENINSLNESYKENQFNNGLINIYDNWKTLCLYDSINRIAINLNDQDKYKLWENEYVLIYVYVIYSRFYLHKINRQLTNLSSESKELTNTRNKFIKFINDYSHSKISYKFLPNEIYKQLKKSLDIEEEIQSIENKISRMNTIRQERNEKRLSRILAILTFLTLISVAYDGGQWLGHKEDINAFYISLTIFGGVAIILFLIYILKKDK